MNIKTNTQLPAVRKNFRLRNQNNRAFAVNYSDSSYEAAKNSPLRQLYGAMRSLREDEMLRYSDRVKLIAWLRSAVRNDSRVASILYRYSLGIGCPTPRISYLNDELKNNELECFLEEKFQNIVYGQPLYSANLRNALKVECRERVIGGECFAVFLANGQIKFYPSELCGSKTSLPSDNELERDGIIYDKQGVIQAYRFGKRVHGRISFDDNVSTIIDAKYVHHLGSTDRIECVRPTPILAPAICTIQDLSDICTAKTSQIKIQSSLALFIQKNIPAEWAAEVASDFGVDEDGDAITASDVALASSGYQTISPNSIMYGEVGESANLIETKFNAQDFDSFMVSNLDFVCGCLGIPPEEAIVGYRRSNYSSARAEKMRWKDTVQDERYNRTLFLDKIQYWLICRGILSGEIKGVSINEVKPHIDWGYPQIREIDEQKAAQAQITYHDAGLKSDSEIASERGRYVDEVQRERARDAARQIKYAERAATEFGVSVEQILNILNSKIKTDNNTNVNEVDNNI